MEKIELNIALIPEKSLDDKLIAVSDVVAEAYPTRVRLDSGDRRLSLAPHLTLMQLPLLLEQLPEADRILSRIASRRKKIGLAATRFAYNQDEGSFEVQREITSQLTLLQEAVVVPLNTLRGGLLLERDPAGNSLQALIDDPAADEQLRRNLQTVGYGEYRELFRPHDTTNWLEPGTALNVGALPLPELRELYGTYVALGMFVLGPQGTCPQRLASYALAA